AERRRERAVGRDDAQAAGTLGDQHAAVGQEGQAPGVLEAAGDGDYLQFAVLAGEGAHGAVGRAGAAGADGEHQGEGEGRLHAVGSLVSVQSSSGARAGQTWSRSLGWASATGWRLSAWKASRSMAIGSSRKGSRAASCACASST